MQINIRQLWWRFLVADVNWKLPQKQKRIDDVNDSVYTETNRKLNDSVMDRIIMTAKNLFVKKDNRQS